MVVHTHLDQKIQPVPKSCSLILTCKNSKPMNGPQQIKDKTALWNG